MSWQETIAIIALIAYLIWCIMHWRRLYRCRHHIYPFTGSTLLAMLVVPMIIETGDCQ